MSPFWLIVPIALSIGGLAHADEYPRASSMLRVGGVLGGGFVDWVGKDADGSRPEDESIPKAGVAVGILAALDLSKLLPLDVEPFHLSAQPGILYAMKGAGVERSGEDRGSFDLSYLQLELLLRGGYATNAKISPYLVLGPELSLLLDAKRTSIAGDGADISDNLKSTDLGLILGVGAMYSLPPVGSLGLELRADLGLVSIDGQGDGDEIRNAALSLLLVYLY